MKKWNYILSGIFTAIGAVFIFMSRNFEASVSNAPGPGVWPKILGTLMIIVAILLVIETYSGKKEDNNRPIILNTEAMKRVYKVMGLTLIFFLAVYLLGMLIGVFLFIPAIMYLLEEYNFKKTIITSVAITVSIYIVFIILLNTPLPKIIFMR